MSTLQPRPSQLDRDGFIQAFGGVYEHSPWIAAGAFDAGLGPDADQASRLAQKMAAVVDMAEPAKKLALLQAHPELAGKLAIAGGLTSESKREQAGAGLDQCSPEEFDQFQLLNQRYRARFDFPFIIAVCGLDRVAILSAFAQRVENSRQIEFETALKQVHRIALLRLRRMVKAD